jgi:tetratricopeptide (TPR) repeat protein
MENSFKYRAFITYAHEDEEKARWLRKKLEGFSVPKNLIGQKGKFGKIPSRLYPIFRDRDELPGSAQLGSIIEQALQDSSHLIVLCSPHAVKSRWVNEEIRLFKQMGKGDRILCLILDGEPMAEDLVHSKGKECLPLAVRRKIDQDGNLVDEIDEPGAADLRDSGDGEKDAVLKIVAGLLGLGLDEIKQRDIIARQRKLALITAFSVLFAFSGIALATYAFFQQQKANQAQATAIEERKGALEELAKQEVVTQFVQSLFFSLDPQNTSGMDTELLKTMLDQGVKRADELSSEPQMEANIRTLIGKTYRSIRAYDQSQEQLEKAIGLFEGESQIRSEALTELALVHEALGNYLQAEPMLAVLLERKTKELGENHDEVIDAKIDLSTVYRRIGKVEKAENLCVSALTIIRDQNRSTEDPRMLKCMNELAKIFLSRDKIAQAESMSRNVFERSRLSLGEKSSVSLIRGQVLVEALRKGGKLDEAEELSVSLVASMEEILGPTHPDTLGAMDALAEIVVSRKDLARGLDLYEQILDSKERMLGEQHPETLSTLKAIARILRLQDLPEEAEEIQFTVYTRLKRKNGLEHPETLRAMNELADLYLDSGKQLDAFQLSNETLIIELRIMGELDPMTLQTRYRIGKLHYLAERKEEAMEELGDVLAKQEKLLGFDHSEVTKTRDLLNEILAERATPVIFLDQNSTPEIPTESETKRSGFLDNFQDDNSSFENNSTILNDELNSSAEMNDGNHSVLILEMPDDSPEHAPVTITEELENKDENATQPDERKVGDDKDTSGFLNRFKKLIPKKSNP